MFTVWKTSGKCPWCDKAIALLEAENLPFEVVLLDQDKTRQKEFVKRGFKTIPQVFEGETHIGGYTELVPYLLQRNPERIPAARAL